ncbi:MAG: hypothetical protein ACR5K2_02050 [Wolbachia sp.]
MSNRGYTRVLRVAKTIADLAKMKRRGKKNTHCRTSKLQNKSVLTN